MQQIKPAQAVQPVERTQHHLDRAWPWRPGLPCLPRTQHGAGPEPGGQRIGERLDHRNRIGTYSALGARCIFLVDPVSIPRQGVIQRRESLARYVF